MMQSPLLIATGAPKEIAGPLLGPFAVAILVTRPTPDEELEEDEDELEEELDPALESLYVVKFKYTTAA